MKTDLAHPDRQTIQSFFNAIPARYAFLTSFFSLGLDLYWRKRTVKVALSGQERSILDLGVGTGKSLNQFMNAHSFDLPVGCDFSNKMLEQARKRLRNRASLLVCDFHELPFPSDSFDMITGSFILRSVQEMRFFLGEVKRVMKKNGKAVFLELTRPENPLVWNLLYKPYLKFYIPFIGKLLSQHEEAYQFLSQSIQSFIEPADLKKDFEAVGFCDVTYQPIFFGAVTIIQGLQKRE